MSQGPDPKPLAGIRVVVTRAPEQAGELVQLLEQQGASVILLPALAFAPVEDSSELDRSIAALSGFNWLILTSQNALRFFLERCAALNVDAGAAGCRIAVVGPGTARAAVESGLRVDWMPEKFSGQALAAGIGGRLAGRKVLLPRSDRASAELPEALRAAGARVTEVVAYRTVIPSFPDVIAKRLRPEGAGIITFTSPSAVHGMFEFIDEESWAGMKLAAIGPTTAAALKALGRPADIVASKSTAAGLVDAIVEHVQTQHQQG